MNLVAETIRGELDARDVKYTVDGDGSARFLVGVEMGQVHVTIQPADNILTIFAQFPFKVPVRKRKAVSEFLMWVNNCVTLGYFIINFNDGRFCFHTPVPMRDHPDAMESLPELFDDIMIRSLYHVEKTWPLINRIIHKNLSPKQAYLELEAGHRSSTESDPVLPSELLVISDEAYN